jgi:hypothetical protein
MTSAAQPNPIEDLAAAAKLRADQRAEEEAEAQAEYVGDLPDDPDEAVHYHPDQDE